ncbi:MAG: ATP-binding protein [Deltaproteobacteria bacterium]|nr:ATP-binding protein [Deltaproteobacteria bacterium]
MGKIVKRLLALDLKPGRSAFLWGPRRVGKSFWIREHFLPGRRARLIDLLQTDVFAEYATRPALLRERWDGRLTVIDEVQRVPALLDEVHWLIENRRGSFLLTGSSARKLRRGHANLLAGRAVRHELGPLSCLETTGFDLERVMTAGLLAPHFLSESPEDDLRGYVADYLREEIAAEAALRNIPAFAEFLRVAAIGNAELLNFTNVGREAGVSAKVVRGYYEILEDTLLGFRLPPWTRAKSRRTIRTEKFYFFDVGVANYLARRKPLPGGAEFGKSFEHYILLELANYRRYRRPDLEIRFWRTASGYEVDFVLDDMRAAIEVKSGARVHEGDLRGLHALGEEHKVRRKVLVCQEREPRRVGDIEILPWRTFVDRLYGDDIV